MHFLLIPYALLCVLFIALYASRRDSITRAGLLVPCGATTLLLFMAMWWRPVAGDSWRYMQYYKALQGMSLADALAYRESDPLYTVLNWVVGGLGNDAAWLFGATLLIYFGVFIAALRRLLSPLDVLVVLMSYTAFPYFIAYGANGLRQGLSLVFLLMAYACLRRGEQKAWVWAMLAPFWHSGAWLGVAVMAAHQLMCWQIRRPENRWVVVFGLLSVSILLSFTGFNQSIMAGLPGLVDLRGTHEIYFENAKAYGYRAGFRLDFVTFSLLPLVTGWLLRRGGSSFDYAGPGWWLSLYISLNVIYHLFSFAPFSDRFAAFSWFILPLVIFMQIREVRSHDLKTLFVGGVCLINVAMLQLYTGNFIQLPRIW